MTANQAWGIGSVAVSALALAGAFRIHERRPRLALALVVAAGALLRGFASADFFLHDWDERFHALVAKNLIESPLRPTLYADPLLPYDHREWFANHVWLHKPPLALWLMAASLALFGVHELAVRVPSFLVSTLGIALSYDTGRVLFDARTGLLAATFQALSGFLIDRASGRYVADHVDTLFVFLIQAGLALAARDVARGGTSWARAAGIGVLTGLAILTKWLPGLLVLLVWVAMLVAAHRTVVVRVVAAGAAAVAVAVPWQVYAYRHYPREYLYERAYDLRHVLEALEGHAGPPWFHLAWMGRFHGELVYLPVAWFLYRCARERQWAQLGVVAWFVAPYLFFSLVATKLWNYVLIAAPALFLMQGWYFWRVLAWTRRGGRRRGFVLLTLLLVLPARFMVERVRPFSADPRTREWTQALKALEARLPPGPCVLFENPRPIEAMFHTHCIAYPTPVGEEQAHDLTRRGYRVIVDRAVSGKEVVSAGEGDGDALDGLPR